MLNSWPSAAVLRKQVVVAIEAANLLDVLEAPHRSASRAAHPRACGSWLRHLVPKMIETESICLARTIIPSPA